jgi:hypothetical protein
VSAKPAPAEAPRPSRLTIGTVCKLLHDEFPDVSISKIRFLEDQKLITPRRTPGGYRLYWTTTSSSCARSCACSATSSSPFASSGR